MASPSLVTAEYLGAPERAEREEDTVKEASIMGLSLPNSSQVAHRSVLGWGKRQPSSLSVPQSVELSKLGWGGDNGLLHFFLPTREDFREHLSQGGRGCATKLRDHARSQGGSNTEFTTDFITD